MYSVFKLLFCMGVNKYGIKARKYVDAYLRAHFRRHVTVRNSVSCYLVNSDVSFLDTANGFRNSLAIHLRCPWMQSGPHFRRFCTKVIYSTTLIPCVFSYLLTRQQS
jgi:hypothetical protein